MKYPQFNVLFSLSILLLTAAVLLAGCGHYGDLYLPEETTTKQEAQDNTEQPEETEAAQPEDL